ncbi:hypothetical protein [Alphaproteobacteria bacterium endosymbiont of Tiliacea citrago]|uniref:hypothetical protein n=1 Tax=Alphaproteobacteria bacterium endosymbiont of Tiliacea citrago TaxID=3077944 RepID=UPI00313E52F3
MEHFKVQNAIDSLLTKICHDLINPLGSAQMAIEENEPEYLNQSIKEAILKVDMYRFLYRTSIDNELQTKKFKEFLEQTKFNILINFQHTKLTPLLFFLSQKMLTKSAIIVNENEIKLEYMFFNEREIKAINGIFDTIDTFNIMLYLAYLQYSIYYKIKLTNLENNKWTMQIKNISNLKELKHTD